MYRQIEKCRICDNSNLLPVLDLGEQMLTGVFPGKESPPVTSGPLRLVRCTGEQDVCGLLQLQHSYDSSEMYGENYGYRSGLNASMVAHLHEKVHRIIARIDLRDGDLVIDIGSNDSTTLQAYPRTGLNLVGVDPTGIKFFGYYPAEIQLLSDFFSSALIRTHLPGKKARIVTSFSMFYDLESPVEFMKEVKEILADDGIWIFEQSYMPTMLETNSFDTVCHEHLEFYSLRQIKWMTERAGFVILDVEFNDVNGGSFSVVVAKVESGLAESPVVSTILKRERDLGLDTLAPYKAFAERVAAAKGALIAFVRKAADEGKIVAALGASTKGNVLLQYCGFSADDIPFVGEVNQEKFGRYTPGSCIPIVPEGNLLAMKPDYLLVLPWHFRAFFERAPKFAGIQLVFPLPCLEVMSRE